MRERLGVEQEGEICTLGVLGWPRKKDADL
jgi:hypothetical protein